MMTDYQLVSKQVYNTGTFDLLIDNSNRIIPNMRKTYLLGAGFSNALANAPVQNEIWNHIVEVNKVFNKKNDIPDKYKENRNYWYTELSKFIKKIESLSLNRFDEISHNYKCIKTELRDNIEYLLTLIDLHINVAPNINFINNDNNVHTEPYPLIPIKETNKKELNFVRGVLTTYLYLVFERLKLNSYASNFANIINKTDNFLTFNYDLILEKVLFNNNLWSPLNGYEGVSEFEYINDQQYLVKTEKYSPLKIHKLHGSINWMTTTELSVLPNTQKILIVLDNLEKQEFFFNNILKREPRKSGGFYVGAHGAYWVLPSYIKLYDTLELFNIWKSACQIISETSNLVIIGYSFRNEDSNAMLLFSNLPSKSTITIVDKYPQNISNKIQSLGYDNIVQFNSIEEFIYSTTAK